MRRPGRRGTGRRGPRCRGRAGAWRSGSCRPGSRGRRGRTSAACARGCPRAGRCRAGAWSGRGGPCRPARPSAASLAARVGTTRRSTSRTLVRYSSSLARSPELTRRPRPSASSRTRSRMLWFRLLPLLSNRESKASEGYTSIGTGEVGARPRDVRAVGHREVGLVVAGDRLLAAQDHARLGGRLAEVAGEQLVDADPALQLGPLLRAPRRRGCCRSGPGGCRRPVACLLNRPLTTLILPRRAASGWRLRPSSIAGARALGPPVVGADPAAHEQGGEPLRAGGRDVADHRGGTPRRGSTPARGGPSSRPTPRRKVRRSRARVGRLLGFAHRLHPPDGGPSTRLFRNWGLVTIASIRPPKRWPSAASRACMASRVASSEGLQAPAQAVGQQLPAEVVDELRPADAR